MPDDGGPTKAKTMRITMKALEAHAQQCFEVAGLPCGGVWDGNQARVGVWHLRGVFGGRIEIARVENTAGGIIVIHRARNKREAWAYLDDIRQGAIEMAAILEDWEDERTDDRVPAIRRNKLAAVARRAAKADGDVA